MAGSGPKSRQYELREQLRRAKRDLENWQAAYDNCCEPADPCKFIAEIRDAEKRLAAARKALGEIAPPEPTVPAVKYRIRSRTALNYRWLKPQGG
ncbi:hypothetical protein SAZ10_28280 [Mesorhizobium sp. BAC0120]|uniref:hypothetical protein n=1 Tax=Mesorhizobium sp. BAC0120 TaxID=3090670 RepID=UPI00298BE69F|nr:hypothetical protein [Mesorhizobium sp. BAC0120]MDW6025667.1 hypothetical protein [Mesorhizobium sp. BAC0120]